ncbi:hypothetical protein HDV00_005053 [Rhizophlyctis rosea]|nr:hypothetical protein HDV00_005053 [Rhizophlyctis rosea]
MPTAIAPKTEMPPTQDGAAIRSGVQGSVPTVITAQERKLPRESSITRRVFSADDASSLMPASSPTTLLHPPASLPTDPRRTVSADDIAHIRRESPYPAAAPRSPHLHPNPRVPPSLLFTPVEEDAWARDAAEAAMREFEARERQSGGRGTSASSVENAPNANTMGKDSGVDVGTLYARRGGRTIATRRDGGPGNATRKTSKKSQPVVIYVSEKESPEPRDKGSFESGSTQKKWARYRMFRKYSGKKRSFFTSVAAGKTKKGKERAEDRDDDGLVERYLTVVGTHDGNGAGEGSSNLSYGASLSTSHIPVEVRTLQRDTRVRDEEWEGVKNFSAGRNRSLSDAHQMHRKEGVVMHPVGLRGHVAASVIPEVEERFPTLLVNGVAEDNGGDDVEEGGGSRVGGGSSSSSHTVDPLYRTVTWNQRGALRVCNAPTPENRELMAFEGGVIEGDERAGSTIISPNPVPDVDNFLGSPVVQLAGPAVEPLPQTAIGDVDMWVDEVDASLPTVPTTSLVQRRRTSSPTTAARRMSGQLSANTKLIRVRSGSVSAAKRASTVGAGVAARRRTTKKENAEVVVLDETGQVLGEGGEEKEWVDQPGEGAAMGMEIPGGAVLAALYPSPPLTPGYQLGVNATSPSSLSASTAVHTPLPYYHEPYVSSAQYQYPVTPISPPSDFIPPPTPMVVTTTPYPHTPHNSYHPPRLPIPHHPYPHHPLSSSSLPSLHSPHPNPYIFQAPPPPSNLPPPLPRHNITKTMSSPTSSFKVINVRHVASGSGGVFGADGRLAYPAENEYAVDGIAARHLPGLVNPAYVGVVERGIGDGEAARRNSSKRSKRRRKFKVLKVFLGKFGRGGGGRR